MELDLYIQVDESGNTVNHPAHSLNLIQAFGEIPSNFEPFKRTPMPIPGPYQIARGFTGYEKINGIWQDAHEFRDMTPEEKQQAQDECKAAWEMNPHNKELKDWVYNEETNSYGPPSKT